MSEWAIPSNMLAFQFSVRCRRNKDRVVLIFLLLNFYCLPSSAFLSAEELMKKNRNPILDWIWFSIYFWSLGRIHGMKFLSHPNTRLWRAVSIEQNVLCFFFFFLICLVCGCVCVPQNIKWEYRSRTQYSKGWFLFNLSHNLNMSLNCQGKKKTTKSYWSLCSFPWLLGARARCSLSMWTWGISVIKKHTISMIKLLH